MRDWKFFILEHKRTVETCRLSMEASVLLLSFLFHSGMIIPLSSGCFAGKSTKFLNLFCWYSFSLFHSLNTSSKYNFILICKGWPAMSSHRRVLSRLLSIRISYKIPICAAVGEIWRNDQISNSSGIDFQRVVSYLLSSLTGNLPLVLTTCFCLRSKSYRDTRWGKIFLKWKLSRPFYLLRYRSRDNCHSTKIKNKQTKKKEKKKNTEDHDPASHEAN